MKFIVRDKDDNVIFSVLDNPDEAIGAVIEFLEDTFDELELTSELELPKNSRYSIEVSY